MTDERAESSAPPAPRADRTDRAPATFVAVGGLMGSGRTTTLLRLAAMALERGRRVWTISPDVAPGLDAAALCGGHGRSCASGGCVTAWAAGPAPATFFAALGRVDAADRPDVILAEPQAHCIDRVMDAVAVLGELLSGGLRVGPYVAVVDPSRARAALEAATGIAQKARFLYRTRQNEAELVALNKCDALAAGECADVERLVAEHFPRGRVMAVSAASGAGFEALYTAALGQRAA